MIPGLGTKDQTQREGSGVVRMRCRTITRSGLSSVGGEAYWALEFHLYIVSGIGVVTR